MKRKLAVVELLKHREPSLLITGQAISNFGDGVANVALTLLVLDTTHSVTALGWFAAARMTPQVVFLLVGGAIVDRFSRRVLLILSDSVRAVLTAGIVLALLTHSLHYSELIVFAVLFGCFDALFYPCIAAFTPEIIGEELLPAMNAVRPLANTLMGNTIGPAAGGLLAAFSATLAIGIDCSTFVLSAFALVLMRATPKPRVKEGATVLGDIKEGLHYVVRTRWLWTTSVSVTLVNAFVLTPMFVLIPYFFRHDLHLGKDYVGFGIALAGISGAIGALVVGNLRMPKRRIRMMWIYWSIGSVTALVMGIATNFWEVEIFPIAVSPMIIFGNVIFESMMQTEVPRELLGRASSVDWFVSLGVVPIGLVVASQVANVVGVRAYFVIFSVICLLPGLWIIASPKINAIDADRVKQVAVSQP
ncbi:MAG TPA: MFS transporter [Acidimicrobiales bacterium]|nr:MFS transporter [Acidimicrobiales bacterium]